MQVISDLLARARHIRRAQSLSNGTRLSGNKVVTRRRRADDQIQLARVDSGHLECPLARRYGKVGGFAHLATLVKRMKATRPGALLLDGGDTWQGSGTALWTNAQDMVDACKALGVNVMTLHWESTYGEARVKEIEEKDFAGQIDIVAQNVKTTDFGAFVSLLPGRDGLVHISKLVKGKRIAKVEDVVNVGDKLRVEIADPELKAALEPADETTEDAEQNQ